MIEDYLDYSVLIGIVKFILDQDLLVVMICCDLSSGRFMGGGGGGCVYFVGIFFYCNFVLFKIREGFCYRFFIIKIILKEFFLRLML